MFGPCEYEDSRNCYWNAQEQGNGIGESFMDIMGLTITSTDLSFILVGATLLAVVIVAAELFLGSKNE